ncbi:isopenicillin N synthase family dioxygenase (plasmid) [Roseomonas sp. CCTCC AB2023176]|uniref:isopenicillin N synthase family dioxygenase n=1 Tax=Roseomonas sp. CCTCC AB2023176 TaxID=3342640 RepID=UPI0035DFEA18
MSAAEIPNVDLTPVLVGDVAGTRDLYGAVDEALRTTGFFTVSGHGVPDAARGGLFAAARSFFALPPEEKLRFRNPRGGVGRGYVPVGAENLGRTLAGGGGVDLKEQVAFGRPDLPDDPYYRQPFAAVAFEPNVWPDRPPGFADAVRTYYREMEALSRRLLGVFAGALGVSQDTLLDAFTHHTSVMRVLHYPDQASAPEAGQTRSGAHTDYGALTILAAEEAPGGLQVKVRDGDWIDVRPRSDRFIINIGDLMAMWTNDRWVSNLHRVVNPPPEALGRASRISVPFFAHANYDALIKCIPTCVAPDETPRHQPVLAGEHRRQKVMMSQAEPLVAS